MFKKLFGVEKKDVKKRCIITPLNETELFFALNIKSKANGIYFKTTQTEYVTIIGTHYNMLIGDCVLYLKNTPCENIYLFGSAGGIGLNMGDKVLIKKALNFESFSDMLKGQNKAATYYPDKKLYEELKTSTDKKIKEGICATVSSLLLEKKHLPVFSKLSVKCVDMECSAVFSAAKAANKKAAALFYISDIILKKPRFDNLIKQDAAKLSSARKSLADFLCGFIKTGS